MTIKDQVKPLFLFYNILKAQWQMIEIDQIGSITQKTAFRFIICMINRGGTNMGWGWGWGEGGELCP